MNAQRRRSRGQPLATLVVLLAGWIILRAAMWEPPFAAHGLPALAVAPPLLRKALVHDRAASAGQGESIEHRETAVPAVRSWIPEPVATKPTAQLALKSGPISVLSPSSAAILEPAPIAFAESMGHRALPPEIAALAGSVRSGARRWHADAWVLYRPGSAGLGASGAFPTYGGSQAGGVVRFALAPRWSPSPQTYLRATRSLRGPGDSEAAWGVSARPIAGLPLRIMGEARIRESGGAAQVRPAILAVTELAALDLPYRSRAEVYAQGGYVGGAQATPFFDGQVVVERVLGSVAAGDLAAGAGALAGGQRGASRLDIGPRASLRMGAGAASTRLAVDWRFRVAGKARPGSGPAVTFSAGF